MILYIAEKPSLARAIAAVLPKPQYKDNGFIRLANGDVVSWCVGHLLEQAQPEDYNPDFKRWQLCHLPILPQKWQLKPRTSVASQLSILKKLIKQADQLVHAGDPDREGQLLVDEVLAYCGVQGQKLQYTQRLLINDLNPPAVKRALAELRPNRDFIPLSTSALARSRADWLYGINMTRAYTLYGQQAGYNGVLSVGRVQTPLLGLVVRRDMDIANFVSKPFYQVLATIETTDKQRFQAQWQPSAACAPYQDEEGRVLVKALAQKVRQKVAGQPALVTDVQQQNKKQFAALPFNLSSLQIDAAKRYGMSAQQVLDVCQRLYERHKLITYPRSDCRYLPQQQWQEAGKVTGALAANAPSLAHAVKQADLTLKSKAWNDSKVDAHHAIIPTEKRMQYSRLDHDEQTLYLLIARQYLAQFYPPYCYAETTVELTIAGGLFRAKARTEQTAGWKALYREQPNQQTSEPADSSQKTDSTLLTQLPALSKGQVVLCRDAEVLEKQTQPPQPFTDASLLAAMTGINRYVQDETIRKVLKDTDGLGTEATRAGIIELLFKRGFLQRQGKQIHATDTGKALINALPAQASLPDMTAQWEAALSAISQRQQSYTTFMQPLAGAIEQLIKQSCDMKLAGLPKKPPRRWPGKKRPAKAKNAYTRQKSLIAVTKRN